ncbi:hypothetical protein RHSIM_Rhsim02G0245500 [Rhododendron simsii]|uniref:Uncharacterized protein n=1 Tax=Rhododendron simsii TaxID=118357 RepID=A0A834HEZ9_RHOSS|nr:hypothetical protein RHSIM_Rhsim02G0245500 [Rhododendron simsii]
MASTDTIEPESHLVFDGVDEQSRLEPCPLTSPEISSVDSYSGGYSINSFSIFCPKKPKSRTFDPKVRHCCHDVKFCDHVVKICGQGAKVCSHDVRVYDQRAKLTLELGYYQDGKTQILQFSFSSSSLSSLFFQLLLTEFRSLPPLFEEMPNANHELMLYSNLNLSV